MTNLEILERMITTQAEYDQMVFKAHGIRSYGDLSISQMTAAIMDEIGELNHEMKARWCWWKKTQEPEDREKVLEELADVIHFILMDRLFNDYDIKTGLNGRIDKAGAESARKCMESFKKGFCDDKWAEACAGSDPVSSMRELIGWRSHDIYKTGGHLRHLIEQCGFTVEEAYEAYMAKNKINRQRVQDGY